MVNRLRQVTSAIKQDGANQVSIITSTAERLAAVEFAKAAAVPPLVVGPALPRCRRRPLPPRPPPPAGPLSIPPRGAGLLAQLLAGRGAESVSGKA